MSNFEGRVVISAGKELDRHANRADCLSPEEMRRARAFHSGVDSRAFQARRVFLRETLGRELGVPAAGVDLTISISGKPAVRSQNIPLWFSQSAVADYTVVAISDEGDVGVDIESSAREFDHFAIARRWFTRSECCRIEADASSGEARLEFLRSWTAREAVAKLTGEGMASAIERYELRAHPMRVVCRDDNRTIEVEVTAFPPLVMAVVWSSKDAPSQPDPSSIIAATQP
jgi:4'-phosphopantetheinyl transferase